MSQRERVYCDVRGFVVDTTSRGSLGDKAPIASGYAYHITEGGKFGTGAFSIEIPSLKPGTRYYYRACAHNLAGWSYGDELTFTAKEKGIWKRITSYLELDGLEVGFPSGTKFKFMRKRQGGFAREYSMSPREPSHQ